MSSSFSLKIISVQDNTQNHKNFLFINESNTDSVEMLIELFGLSTSLKILNRITDISKKIETFLDIRNQLFKQITFYRNTIPMIYDGSINEAYVMGDLCQYLIEKSGISKFLDHGTSIQPLSHEILFIGAVRPAINTVLYFKES